MHYVLQARPARVVRGSGDCMMVMRDVAIVRSGVIVMMVERSGLHIAGTAEQHAARRVALQRHGNEQQAGDEGAQDAVHAAESKGDENEKPRTGRRRVIRVPLIRENA
jgi:hypothetical protein